MCCSDNKSKPDKIERTEYELPLETNSEELLLEKENTIVGKKWQLNGASIRNNKYQGDGYILPVNAWITFQDKMILNGRDGCNKYFGTYEFEPNANSNNNQAICIQVSGNPKMYCSNNSDFFINENDENDENIKFILMLQNVNRYNIIKVDYNYILKLSGKDSDGDGFILEFIEHPQVVEGRPIKEDNKIIVAEIHEETNKCISWSEYTFSDELKLEILSMTSYEKEKFVKKWLEAAQHEHSSVSSFAQIILELSRYGASSNLLEMTNKAMLDEIKHTKIALGLASIASNKRYRIDELKLDNIKIRDKQTFKEENYKDACINEAEASKSLYEESRQYEFNKPELAKILEEMAADESRHALLGEKIDKWLSLALITPL